jgi:hypothetical protein
MSANTHAARMSGWRRAVLAGALTIPAGPWVSPEGAAAVPQAAGADSGGSRAWRLGGEQPAIEIESAPASAGAAGWLRRRTAWSDAGSIARRDEAWRVDGATGKPSAKVLDVTARGRLAGVPETLVEGREVVLTLTLEVEAALRDTAETLPIEARLEAEGLALAGCLSARGMPGASARADLERGGDELRCTVTLPHGATRDEVTLSLVAEGWGRAVWTWRRGAGAAPSGPAHEEPGGSPPAAGEDNLWRLPGGLALRAPVSWRHVAPRWGEGFRLEPAGANDASVGLLVSISPLDSFDERPRDVEHAVALWRKDMEDDGAGFTTPLVRRTHNGLEIVAADLAFAVDGGLRCGPMRLLLRDEGIVVVAGCCEPRLLEGWRDRLSGLLDTIAAVAAGPEGDAGEWITWRDVEHGVELRTPQGWSVNPDAGSPEGEEVIVLPLRCEDTRGRAAVTVGLKLAALVPPGQEPQIVLMGGEPRDIEIDGTTVQANRIDYGPGRGAVLGHLVRHQRMFYVSADWWGMDDEEGALDSLVHSILATLRFLGPAAAEGSPRKEATP